MSKWYNHQHWSAACFFFCTSTLFGWWNHKNTILSAIGNLCTSTHLSGLCEFCTVLCNIVSKQFKICLSSMFDAILYAQCQRHAFAYQKRHRFMDLCFWISCNCSVYVYSITTPNTALFIKTSIFTLNLVIRNFA